jgi:hypothetical protein
MATVLRLLNDAAYVCEAGDLAISEAPRRICLVDASGVDAVLNAVPGKLLQTGMRHSPVQQLIF